MTFPVLLGPTQSWAQHECCMVCFWSGIWSLSEKECQSCSWALQELPPTPGEATPPGTTARPLTTTALRLHCDSLSVFAFISSGSALACSTLLLSLAGPGSPDDYSDESNGDHIHGDNDQQFSDGHYDQSVLCSSSPCRTLYTWRVRVFAMVQASSRCHPAVTLQVFFQETLLMLAVLKLPHGARRVLHMLGAKQPRRTNLCGAPVEILAGRAGSSGHAGL